MKTYLTYGSAMAGGGFILVLVLYALGFHSDAAKLGAGVMITLFAALIGIVTSILYMQIINPGMNDIIIQAQIAKWEAANMPAARMEQAESMMRKMMSPPIQICFQFLGGMFFGTIISLITAAFLKRSPADELQRA